MIDLDTLNWYKLFSAAYQENILVFDAETKSPLLTEDLLCHLCDNQYLIYSRMTTEILVPSHLQKEEHDVINNILAAKLVDEVIGVDELNSESPIMYYLNHLLKISYPQEVLAVHKNTEPRIIVGIAGNFNENKGDVIIGAF